MRERDSYFQAEGESIRPSIHQKFLAVAKEHGVFDQIDERRRKLIDAYYNTDAIQAQLREMAGGVSLVRVSSLIKTGMNTIWDALPREMRQQYPYETIIQPKPRARHTGEQTGVVEEPVFPLKPEKVNILETNRHNAVQRLDTYLQTPKEQILREHQSDVMQSLRNAFASLETAGYISLPTGTGKTVLITEIADVFGMKTVIASPTQQILEQTARTAQNFTPTADVTNYYADSKDLSGRIVNTTYQSLQALLRRGVINPEEVELLILDETDTALGEKRHQIFRQFPNALLIGLTASPYFTPLEGYTERGIVSKEERWVNLFKNCFHEMTLEEAIERGILTNLDVHLLKTNMKVGSVQITSGGEYNEAEMNRYLNRQARNYLTVGMVAGLDKIPESVNLSLQQREEISKIHEQIKGKRIAIFGLGIDHVETLAAMLTEQGVGAATVNSKIEADKRREILDAHTRGEIPIVLGVDMLRRGWDSPATEVGIFLAPTQSGIVAVQELGRILRQYNEKDRAIAIQLVDQYQSRLQAPILIPNLFDPYYVLRGTQTGEKTNTYEKRDRDRTVPTITFSGMDIDVVVEEARSRELLQARFKQASITEMDQTLKNIVAQIQEENPDISAFHLYRLIVDVLPGKIPNEAQEATLQAVASIDSNTVDAGKQALVYLNMKSILSAIEHFITEDAEENDEIVQAAITSVLAKITNPNPKLQITQQVYLAAVDGAASYVASRDNMPISWSRETNVYQMIHAALEAESIDEGRVLTNDEIDSLARELGGQTEISESRLRDYLLYRNRLKSLTEQDENLAREEHDPVSETMRRMLIEDIGDVLFSFSQRERDVLRLRFGLEDGRERTFTEAGKDLGLSRERIRQIEAEALMKLRLSTRSEELLLTYLEPEYVSEYKAPARKVDEMNNMPEDRNMLNEMDLEPSVAEKLRLHGIKRISQIVAASIEDMTTVWQLNENEMIQLLLKTINKVGHAPPKSRVHQILILRVTDELLFKSPITGQKDDTLSKMEQDVLNIKFGHFDGRRNSDEQIGKVLNIPVREVKNIETSAREELYLQTVINMERQYHELMVET